MTCTHEINSIVFYIPLALARCWLVAFLPTMMTLLGTVIPGDSSLARLMVCTIGLGVVVDVNNGELPSPSQQRFLPTITTLDSNYMYVQDSS